MILGAILSFEIEENAHIIYVHVYRYIKLSVKFNLRIIYDDSFTMGNN